MDERIQKIENDLETIRTRNARVEADKAWETSWVRRLCVAVFTYLPIAIYMSFIGVKIKLQSITGMAIIHAVVTGIPSTVL